MTPTTRSNRAENLTVVSSGITANTRGLATLPNELYLEILSHLPAPSENEKPDPYRQLALYYLTQTCFSLRKFFLRYAWERIEASGAMWSPNGKLSGKKLVGEILRQLETVTVRNPELRKYVTTVDLTIPRFYHNAVVAELAQGLSLFPNVHTLRLVFQTGRDSSGTEKVVFSNFRYPSVRTLNLDTRSRFADILQSCPNATYLSFNQIGVPWRTLRQCFERGYASSVEKLGMIWQLPHLLPESVKHLPRLGDITLDYRSLGACAPYLSLIPLHTIRLQWGGFGLMDFNGRHVPLTPDEYQKWIDLTKRILAKCPQSEVPKRVIVVNVDKTVDTYRV